MRERRARRGFTMTELMVVIAIIMLLAVAVVTSMFGAAQSAKRIQTEQTVRKIDSLLMPRWESYMTRRLPLNALPTTGRATFAVQKLWAMRELLRMDFPDRYPDLMFQPVFLIQQTSNGNVPYYSDASRLYQRLIVQWTGTPVSRAGGSLALKNGAAECLYLQITANAQDSDLAGSAFRPDEVGDKDGDLMPEFLDAWGNPIQFLRWAPGFVSDMQPQFQIPVGGPSAKLYPSGLPKDPTGQFLLSHFPMAQNTMTAGGTAISSSNTLPTLAQLAAPSYHDAFDPLEVDPRLVAGNAAPVPERGFNLIPLIVSAGPDGVSGALNFTGASTNTDTIDTSFGLHFGTSTQTTPSATNPLNSDDDPFMSYASPDGSGQTQRGAIDASTGGASYDNIHNHLMRTRP